MTYLNWKCDSLFIKSNIPTLLLIHWRLHKLEFEKRKITLTEPKNDKAFMLWSIIISRAVGVFQHFKLPWVRWHILTSGKIPNLSHQLLYQQQHWPQPVEFVTCAPLLTRFSAQPFSVPTRRHASVGHGCWCFWWYHNSYLWWKY